MAFFAVLFGINLKDPGPGGLISALRTEHRLGVTDEALPFQMSQREAGLVLPERDTVLRLSVMSLFGTLSVILTLILLCFAANGTHT